MIEATAVVVAAAAVARQHAIALQMAEHPPEAKLVLYEVFDGCSGAVRLWVQIELPIINRITNIMPEALSHKQHNDKRSVYKCGYEQMIVAPARM